ncbi:Bol3p [Sporobolomyces koalae]|uniref:Bol3p n=1 Tax=Sporobolomyces koalae TaxID=500713 RepID=UPI00318217E7
MLRAVLPTLRATPRRDAFVSRTAIAVPRSTPNIRSLSSSSVLRSASLSDGEQLLKTKLEESLEGAKVQVQDVSGGCGSFYAIQIEHESFKGLNTIKQHRIVNQLLKDEIKAMHGLQLKTSAP